MQPHNLKDLTGKKFGRLTAIERTGSDKRGEALWKFQCDCGNIVALPSYRVRKGFTISCGCYRKDQSINRGKDLKGQRFGRLIVLERIGLDKFKQNIWKCRCDCGNEVTERANQLLSGKVRSCGCLKSEGNNTRHGMCYTRLNSIYRKMKERCLQVNNPRYEDYGGRGIKVCDEWLGKNGFENFYKWAMENGYREDLTIDRIDNSGNYEPSNCRWADDITQMNNMRSNHLLTYNGETHTVAEWARIMDMPYQRLLSRINKLHWSVERALTEGVNGFK